MSSSVSYSHHTPSSLLSGSGLVFFISFVFFVDSFSRLRLLLHCFLISPGPCSNSFNHFGWIVHPIADFSRDGVVERVRGHTHANAHTSGVLENLSVFVFFFFGSFIFS